MRRVPVLLATIALAVLSAGGCAGATPTSRPSVSPAGATPAVPRGSPRTTPAAQPPESGFSIDAGVVVRGGLADRRDGRCRTTGSYADIAAGAPVTLVDTASGDVLARGTLRDETVLGPQASAASLLECWYRFTIHGVPAAAGYGFEIAGTSGFQYEAAEVRSVLGFLRFTVGGPAMDGAPIGGLAAGDIERALELECRDRSVDSGPLRMRDCVATDGAVTTAALLTSLPTGELVSLQAVAAGIQDDRDRATAHAFLRRVAELPWEETEPARDATWVENMLEWGGFTEIGMVRLEVPQDPPPGVTALFVEGIH